MRITSIEISNYRAFKGAPLKIDLHAAGKNLLVYGENGSGKSSLYLALKNFLECAAKNHNIIDYPFRNLFVQTDDCYIKLQFSNKNGYRDPDAKLYEWSNAKNDTGERLILELDKTKGFIDYKALLATYFLHQEKTSVNVFDLFVTSIVANVENDLTKRTFGEEWRKIKQSIPRRNAGDPLRQLDQLIQEFNDGLREKLKELTRETGKILTHFGYDIAVEFTFGGIAYKRESKTIENQLIGLKVKFFRKERDDHHHFLNEAKLSAIAISVFFAALLLQPRSRLRILALDDVLIGLDMSNRMPVLDILDKHFDGYQIFFFTYDRVWYEIIRQRNQTWKHVEFFACNTDEGELPIYAEDKKYLDKAREYFQANDYRAAAIYLRTHFEVKLKEFCDKKNLKVKYKNNPKHLQAKDFWTAVCDKDNGGPFTSPALTTQVDLCLTNIMNPLCHSRTINFHKKEIQ
ncbi:MAG TPA: AAA family ATPase, partial [Nitrososphaera sp.]|nr:AAA family ATPase [Nitrososphaera sp.]